MRVELATLEGSSGEFSHTYAPEELALADSRLRLVVGPSVSGKITREGRRVKMLGSVIAQLQVECDRCLKFIDLPVESTFKLEYVTLADYEAQQAVELTEDDLDLAVFDGEVIDIDALVTEELLLTVPDHMLCNTACQGICLVCGVDRNAVDCGCQTAEVDPRWAGLKELVNGK